MDPPDHSRLRRLLTRSFTPRAVAALTDAIEATAARLVDRMIAGAAEGRCDFAKDVAADLPLITLAEVLGVPAQDRWLIFDWSNRVIGWQDPDYASSAAFDGTGGTPMAREALALRPSPGPDGRMPDPRTRAGMPDLYAYARLLAEEKRRAPGTGRHVDPAGPGHDDGGQISDAEFENMFWLFAVAGNETLRNGLPGGLIALLQHPEQLAALRADPSLLPTAVEEMLRWWTPVMVFRRTATGTSISPALASGPATRSSSRSPRPTATSACSPTPTGSTSAARPTRISPSGTGRTSASAPSWPGCRCGRCSASCSGTRAASSSTAIPCCSARTSSAASSACRIRWTAA